MSCCQSCGLCSWNSNSTACWKSIWQVVGDGDRYITEHEPWKLNKTDPARARTVLYVLPRRYGILRSAQPFMPQSIERMLNQLAVPAEARTFASLGEKGALKPGTPLPKPKACSRANVEEAAQ
jgi:methionyl-tRNA synthetase